MGFYVFDVCKKIVQAGEERFMFNEWEKPASGFIRLSDAFEHYFNATVLRVIWFDLSIVIFRLACE